LKFTCDKSELSKILKNISVAAATKTTTIPAMQGVLMELTNNKLKLSCYDLKIGMSSVVDVVGSEDGEIVVSAEVFSNIAQKIKGDKITFTSGERNIVSVSSGRSKFRIVGMNPEEFPYIPNFDVKKSFSGNGKEIKTALKSALIATLEDGSAKATSGINCKVKENVLTLSSVNGVVGVQRTVSVVGEDLEFIIPGKECRALLKLLDIDDIVSFSLGERHLLIKVGQYTIVTRLLEGNFPVIDSLMKINPCSEIVVDRKELKLSLECVSLVNTQRIAKPVKVSISEDGISLYISSNLGESNEFCAVESFSGEELTIGLSPVHMSNVVDSLTSDMLKFSFGSSRSPVIIYSEKDNEKVLIAPIVLQDTP
jgi:DNA polymerase-3 subunit beta